MSIRDEMPVLARHEGDWVGTYLYVDNDGNVLDKHASHLSCQFTSDPARPYYQINRYTWADGREEEHRFPAAYHDRQIWFDTDRIQGHSWEVDGSTLVLTWVYKREPDQVLYEMIQISPCGRHRARTWHWFKNGEIVKRTLIKETKLK
ncbi:MAG: DUF3598 domain-containing protein [Acidobacteria bacterium]|nr:DUF3598 domain-containing protein [Acidobacteriota bacterium]